MEGRGERKAKRNRSAGAVVVAGFGGDFGTMPVGRQAPLGEVVGVEADAEKVCGDEAELRRPDADEANNQAIQRCDDPPVPEFSADQDGGDDGQHAG